MRAALLLAIAAGGAAAAAMAQAPTAEPLTPREQALQQALIAAQRDAAEQRRLAGEARDQAALLATCREKNARLVTIGEELIRAYEQRYRGSHYLPFQVGRRKFEAELQATGDRIYDNRLDAQPRQPAPAASAAPAGTPPAGDTPSDSGTTAPTTREPSQN